jgi:hypothetical protein
MIVLTQTVVAVGTLCARWTGCVAFAQSSRETDGDGDGDGDESESVLQCSAAAMEMLV